MRNFLEGLCRPINIRTEAEPDIPAGQKMFPALTCDPYDVTEVPINKDLKKEIETNHNYLAQNFDNEN